MKSLHRSGREKLFDKLRGLGLEFENHCRSLGKTNLGGYDRDS